MERKKITHKIARDFIAIKQSSSSSCCALFHFPLPPDFMAAGCLKLFFLRFFSFAKKLISLLSVRLRHWCC